MRVRGLLPVAAALTVLAGGQAQQPAESGDVEKLVLPALELRDPALRSVLGDEVAWSEELRLRAWLAVEDRAERVVREPMFIHAFNRLLPEQGGPVSGRVLWYPVPLRHPPVGLLPNALVVELPTHEGIQARASRATHLAGLAAIGELPRQVYSHATGGVATQDLVDRRGYLMRVLADHQQQLANWSGARIKQPVYSVVAGRIESISTFASEIRECVHWVTFEEIAPRQAEAIARRGVFEAVVGFCAEYSREELALIRACDDRLRQAVRKRSDVSLVGTPSPRDISKAEQEGDGLVAGVVIRVLDSQGTRRGIVVPSLWQCCLGRPPKQNECLQIRWVDETEGEAAVMPAVFRTDLAEIASAEIGQEVSASELQVLR